MNEDFYKRIRYTPKESNVHYVKRNSVLRGSKNNLRYANKRGMSKKTRRLLLALGIGAITAVGACTIIKEPKPDPSPIIDINPIEKEDELKNLIEEIEASKQYYKDWKNEDGDPITEENMNEELAKIKESIKKLYKYKIAKACGVDLKDADKITGVEEEVSNMNDKHIRVCIPESISPTGETIYFIDEQVPDDIKTLIKVAGSINTGLNYKYNDSKIVWGKAMNALESATMRDETEYTFINDGEKSRLEEVKQAYIEVSDDEER